MKNNDSSLSLSAILLVVFIILKLCKVINWSWLWVLSPIWISISLYFIVYFVIYLIYKDRWVIMKRYIKDNKKIFKLINNEKYKILEIRPIRKRKKNKNFNTSISSYCVIYEKMI